MLECCLNGQLLMALAQYGSAEPPLLCFEAGLKSNRLWGIAMTWCELKSRSLVDIKVKLVYSDHTR